MSPCIAPGTIASLSAEPQPRLSGQEDPPSSWSDDQRILAREIQARLKRTIRKLCPPHMASHTDDVVQLAMLRVMRSAETHRDGEGAEAPSASYLWKVAYTTTIDELRKVRSQQNTLGNAAQASAAEPSAFLSPESTVEGKEIGGAIRDCIEVLHEDRRRAVVLHLQGHLVPEAASLLGWTRKRAENLVYRGLSDLRRCLATKGFQR